MTLLKSFSSILLFHVALFLVVVHAEDDRSGFISIDCGLPEGSDYTDDKTGINYVSDAGFTEAGISREISPEYKVKTEDLHLTTLRFFPESIRNCYTLAPKQGKNNTYLIRASFKYGNYDFKSQPPIFDFHLGTDFRETINSEYDTTIYTDIIQLTSTDYLKVCLVNTDQGFPFISALEVRLLDSTMYEAHLLALDLGPSLNFGGSDEVIRYKDDKFDRIWDPHNIEGCKVVQTSDTVPSGNFYMPSKVMSTAITPINYTENLVYTWNHNYLAFYRVYLHFAEVETLKNNTRVFNIYLNGNLAYGPFSPTTDAYTIIIESSVASLSGYIVLNKTNNSTLTPIINALEVYAVTQFRQEQTDEKDDAAISNAKSMYGLKKNWQGDPCLPHDYVWDGVTCRYNDTGAARIISLNLSSSELSGEIATALGNLTMIESLDLSYNNLTGTVPDFLAKLKNLKFLNLRGNNFSRPLPPELLEKSKKGSLMLSIEAISDEEKSSCIEGSCKNKRSKVLIGVVAATSLLIVFAIIWTVKMCKTKDLVTRDEPFRTRNQKFTYSEVESITNNFKTRIGIGGFGEVFLGSIGDNQVAVKILSASSEQGYKEFLAEVKILMDVRHKNITPLIGYCEDKNHKAIIYEYMANGNLEKHLFDGSPNVLSWERRLQIGCDVAEGLAYMHHGCTPLIVHRDIKSSNILLNEGFQAKLADFGLSRAFATANDTHVATTMGAGTPGYLDPEYHSTCRLTEKSDVFSFGVVLLELITGRRAISEGIHVIFWVESTVEEGSVENIIDPRLDGLFNISIAWKVFELANACVSPTSIERPTMNEVVVDLKQCLEAEKNRDGSEPNNQSGVVSLNMETMSDLIPR